MIEAKSSGTDVEKKQKAYIDAKVARRSIEATEHHLLNLLQTVLPVGNKFEDAAAACDSLTQIASDPEVVNLVTSIEESQDDIAKAQDKFNKLSAIAYASKNVVNNLQGSSNSVNQAKFKVFKAIVTKTKNGGASSSEVSNKLKQLDAAYAQKVLDDVDKENQDAIDKANEDAAARDAAQREFEIAQQKLSAQLLSLQAKVGDDVDISHLAATVNSALDSLQNPIISSLLDKVRSKEDVVSNLTSNVEEVMIIFIEINRSDRQKR